MNKKLLLLTVDPHCASSVPAAAWPTVYAIFQYNNLIDILLTQI